MATRWPADLGVTANTSMEKSGFEAFFRLKKRLLPLLADNKPEFAGGFGQGAFSLFKDAGRAFFVIKGEGERDEGRRTIYGFKSA